ncbi:SDR family NAD(P)-dependent oxidoreductase [Nocardioides marmotae]|uniref:SDR family NAD(P)-dependent oxidoreductase n=1 Tax=Nocardioides marmotae TaxID=2663857 RepID=UPI002934F2BD|nr:SDR family oxidoreductase [Nocardioides marmotae]
MVNPASPALADPFDLTGEVALVVGAATGGLGERAARTLADRGATVVTADIDPSAVDHAVDVTDEASVDALVTRVLADHGRLDVLVHAAGLMLRKAYDETTPEEFERVVRVNLTGTWLVDRAAGRVMAAAGRGRIVNLTTVYAERVGPVPESAYYASKAGVLNVTRALAAELGPSGVTVNCLAPGVFYPTKMTAPLGEDPERLAWFSRRTMLGRLGDLDGDLDGPLLLLASRASAYVTGQVVYVDGGWSAW